MIEFTPLVLAQRPAIMEALREFPPRVSELTFTNLYVWRYHRPVRVAQVDSALLFADVRTGELSLIGAPCGEVDWPPLLNELRDAGIVSFERVPAEMAEELRRAGLRVAPDRGSWDYVYARRDLAELSGRRYHRQKNLVNRCLGAHQCEYCLLGPDLIDETVDMLDRWFADRQMGQSLGLAEEYWALRETLDHFEDFDLVGGAVRVDGRIEAFTFGEALNEDSAVVHFEKAMTGYPGLYQVVNQWFCRHGLAGSEFVNREQDLGVPGLRQAKESYHPHHMVEKFTARWGP